jgi:two-component system chemotaxis sensor kinase CheA
MAASMGFSEFKEFSHQLEDLLQQLKEGRLTLDEEVRGLLLQALDLIETMVNEIDRIGSSRAEPRKFQEALEKVLAKASPAETPTRRLEIVSTPRAEGLKEESKYFFKIEMKISEESSMPAARALILYKRMEEMGKISRSVPSLEEILAGNTQRDLICYLVTSRAATEIQDALKGLPEIADLFITAVDPFTRSSAPAEPASTLPSDSFKTRSIRIDVRKLDHVLEGLGELLIQDARLQDLFGEHPEVSRLHALAGRLYKQASTLRMLPFETLSSAFPRIVYDLSKRLQKKVRLRVEGADLQIDKSVLDELVDPLIHLLRNAIDHGIELPAVRLSQGKEETGSIIFVVLRQGDRILLRIEDDGQGLDPHLIRKTAIGKGFISERAVDFLNQQEILLLTTRPGFSTAGEVSDLSGRGVGLDVVRSKVDSLGGTLKIFSEPGTFTRFEIVVPSTLAVFSAVFLRAGSSTYAVPLTQIERFLQLSATDIQYVGKRPVIFYEDSTIYVEHLDSILQGTEAARLQGELSALVSEHQNRRIAWCVDEFQFEKQILVQPLPEPLALLRCYSGTTVIGKGEVVPVLDLEQLYRERFQ